MDPMEFRILNAYRDGDMKAHRREAKNTALVECVQVAAEKANWPLRETARRASSLSGGGGARAAIPPTLTDESGRIGRPETRQAPPQLTPAQRRCRPIGSARVPTIAARPQPRAAADMQRSRRRRPARHRRPLDRRATRRDAVLVGFRHRRR